MVNSQGKLHSFIVNNINSVWMMREIVILKTLIRSKKESQSMKQKIKKINNSRHSPNNVYMALLIWMTIKNI